MFPKEWTPPCGSRCTKKYATLIQIPWRVFCKKGCDADGDTWEEYQDEWCRLEAADTRYKLFKYALCMEKKNFKVPECQ